MFVFVVATNKGSGDGWSSKGGHKLENISVFQERMTADWDVENCLGRSSICGLVLRAKLVA